MIPVMVDSNVILDIATRDPKWESWSSEALERAANELVLVINPGKVSSKFSDNLK